MITLTDWPKTKQIEANYRGMETDELFDKWKNCFHLMMPFDSELANGWHIVAGADKMEEELKFRKDGRIEKFLNGEKV